MKALIVILVLLFATTCYGATLWHATDKATGEERGVLYSKAMPANPSNNYVQIDEKQKDYYMKLYKDQEKAKEDAYEQDKDTGKKSAKTKLKALGFTGKECKAILDDAYGD